MALFNPESMKLGKPIKRKFMGGDVYILAGLNAAQGLQFSEDARAINVKCPDFSLRLAAAHIRARVVDSKGAPLFADLSIDDLMSQYDADKIDGLYAVVIAVTGDPFRGPKEAEKNS